MGVVLLVLVGMVTEYTLYILVSTGVSVGCFSYQEVMRRAFGRSGYILVTIVQFATAFLGERIILPVLGFNAFLSLYHIISTLLYAILKLKLPLFLPPSSNGVLYYYSGRCNYPNNQWNM